MTLRAITGAGEACLALPKLNLQFLTFHDYLLRNFNLFRLEATYEVLPASAPRQIISQFCFHALETHLTSDES